MSSTDEAERAAPHPAATAQKKRKMVQRACDSCRRKKIGCDGARTANRRCSRCAARGIECTYADPFYKSQYPEGYVESLENRIKRMEEVINRLSSNPEAGGALDKESTHRASPGSGYRNITPSSSGPTSPAFRTYPPAAASPTTAHDRDADDDDGNPSDSDDTVSSDVLQRLSDLSLDPMVMRYWGKSSGLTFVCTTLGIREQYLSEMTPETAREKLSPKKLFDAKLRHHAWLDISPVEEPIAAEKFPPADLMDELVESYFRQSNDFLPLLHEPTFRAGIKQNLHLRVPGFGCTVLLVCAFGARFSHDPRVLLDGSTQWQSAGWKWYKVVDDRHKSWLAPAHLYDLQSCVLMALYMHGSTTPHLTWTIVGIGMRKALDVGAHRKGMYHPTPTVEDELWRRAFWALVVLEWGGSHGLGRPPCIYDEEFDLTLPTECDDEYWTNPDPEKAFKQPPDKPSKVTFFIHYIELTRLITHATRTIYSLGKSRARLGSDGPHWEEKVVAELDSEMNHWLDSVPEHLRWDPDREDELFLSQSGAIYAHFYQVQIGVHRSFITSRKGDPLSLASLIICTNAARSCVQVLEKVTNRIGTPNHRNGIVLFLSGLVLVMSMWGQKRSKRMAGAQRDLDHINSVIRMLGLIERENHIALIVKEILQTLSTFDGPPPPTRTQETPQEPTAGGDSSRTADGSSTVGSAQSPSYALGGAGVQRPAENDHTRMDFSWSQPRASSSSTAPSATRREVEMGAFNGHGQDVPLASLESMYRQMDPIDALLPSAWEHAPAPYHGLSAQSPGPSSGAWGVGPADMSPSSFVQLQGAGASAPSLRGHAGAFMGAPDAPQAGGPAPFTIDFAALGAGMGMGMGLADGGPGADSLALADSAIADETLNVWSEAPNSMGWEYWEAYFNPVNGAEHANHQNGN